MKVAVIAAAMLFSASAVSAQEVIDNSDKELAKKIAYALVTKTPDPFAAQIFGLHISAKSADYVCGKINLKNQNGGYVGFTTFTFDQVNSVVWFEITDFCDGSTVIN